MRHIRRRTEHQHSYQVMQAAGKGELIQAKSDEINVSSDLREPSEQRMPCRVE
jgi:hypothetical protein